ncbi:MAG: hypothetical protein V2A67_11515 [Bacteroidota bacterium]
MHPVFLKYPIFLALFLGVSNLAYSQESRNNFDWRSGNDTPMSGVLVVTTTAQSDKLTYQMDFSVTWMDANGSVITDASHMPFLYLSRYDIEINPAGLKCTNFEQNHKFELTFPSSGRLMFSAQEGFVGDCIVTFGFQYALSREKIAKGELERIGTPSGKRIRVTLNIPDRTKTDENKIVADNRDNQVADHNRIEGSEQGYQFQRLQIRWMEFMNRKSAENLEKEIADIRRQPSSEVSLSKINELRGIATLFNTDLDNFKTDVKQFESNLDNSGISRDTASGYKDKVTNLLGRLTILQTIYNQYRLQLTSLLPVETVSLADPQRDSLLNGILEKYKPDFTLHKASISELDIKLKDVLQKLKLVTLNRKLRRSYASETDSLISEQEIFRSDAEELVGAHNTIWSAYRNDVITLNLIPELENLHSESTRAEQSINQTNGLIDPIIQDITDRREAIPWFRSNWAISGGLLIVLVLVIFLTIRNIIREKKLQSGEIRISDNSPDTLHTGKSANSGIFPDGVPEAYYSSDFRETLPESVIGKIHYSFSSIKAVYQMVHGAFMEKRAGDFGGYLFGNQYKLPGNGAAHYEMIVEKACASKHLRPDIQNDMEVRADLMDELDEIVKQNKKYLLIGWFTSSSDNSLEIQEGLMKIHRNFFKEKWQFGLLINHGSEELQSAVFLRRKSGYIEPYPDPASFVKWEELYQYSINPPVPPKNGTPVIDHKEADYLKLSFNLTWSDSVLRSVSFHKQVTADIHQASSFVSVPDESYQLLGYLYGAYQPSEDPDRKLNQFDIFVERFVEIANESSPRDIPGYTLLGWWGQGKSEIFTYLPSAISYHEQLFREPYQICCLVNALTGEIRIFTRKMDLTMNNNVIETEEFNLSQLV